MKTKNNHFDILTLLSLIAIAISSSAMHNTSAWGRSAMALAAVSRWGVTAFIAAHGVRFFGGSLDYSLKHIIKKLVLPSASVCAVFWIAAALLYMNLNFPNDMDRQTFFECMAAVSYEPYNIRLLQLIFMMAVFTPIMQKAAKNIRLTGYTVLIFFLLGSVNTILTEIPYVGMITSFTNQVNWGFFTAYGLYALLGCYIDKAEFEWHWRVVIYSAGVLCTAALYALSIRYTANDKLMTVIGDSSPLTALQTASVMVFIKYLSRRIKLSDNTRIKLRVYAGGGYIMAAILCVAVPIIRIIPGTEQNTAVVILNAVLALALSFGIFMIIYRAVIAKEVTD